jgi:hypothetical protein
VREPALLDEVGGSLGHHDGGGVGVGGRHRGRHARVRHAQPVHTLHLFTIQSFMSSVN